MGLHDRHYMRPDNASAGARLRRLLGRATAAHWATGALVAAGIVQFALTAAGQGGWLRANVGLTTAGLRAGKVWEILTYALVHADFWHLFFNAAGLFFLGRGLCEERGSRKFWKIFLAGVAAGALLWASVWALPVAQGHELIGLYRTHATLVGASAGVFAIMAYYMADKLREEFRLLIFFIVPVTLEGSWILGITGALSVAGLFLTEIPVATGYWPAILNDPMSHSAHIAGLATGFLWRLAETRLPALRATRHRESFAVLPKNAVAAPGRESRRRFPTARTPEPDLRSEVDRILDKINANGFGSLTPEERATLERAREAMRR